MTVNVGILVLDKCVGLSVHGPIDLFNTANIIARQTGRGNEVFATRLLSIKGGEVETSSGHLISTELATDSLSDLDVLIIPGVGIGSAQELEEVLAKNRVAIVFLLDLAHKGTRIAASCTGTFLLAESRLLDGKKATTTWWMADAFRSRFSQIELLEDEMLVDEGQFATSAAGASSLDLALHLISQISGPSLARLCARFLVVDGGRKSQRLYTVPWHNGTRDPVIEEADAWIRRNPSTKPRVDDLAKHLGVGTRTLLRKFQSHTGMTPQGYIQNFRLEQAKALLETSNEGIAQVAGKVGFSDENAFRRSFTQRTGVSPTQYRKQFNWS